MIIIGLTGKAGAGKDTVGEILERKGFVRYSLAGELKQAVLDLNPLVNHVHFSGVYRLQEVVDNIGMDRAKREIPEVRRLLQVFGTEVIRSRDENFWIRALERRILDEQPERIVITDVRFDNEAEWVHKTTACKVIDVQRPSDLDEAAANGHASEAGVSPELIDDVIVNNGTLEDLEMYVSVLAATLG